MPRSRIEGLLASFPKLTSTGQQHTIAENEHVRFVYQPLDELFIVLITNRQVIVLYHLYKLMTHVYYNSQTFYKTLNHFICLLALLPTFVTHSMRLTSFVTLLNYCVPLTKLFLSVTEKT